MKFSCDVACTPEEARRFLGLPDITPVHEAYVARMTKAVGEGLTPDMIAETMRSWGPMTEAGSQMFKTMFEQMTGQATGTSTRR